MVKPTTQSKLPTSAELADSEASSDRLIESFSDIASALSNLD